MAKLSLNAQRDAAGTLFAILFWLHNFIFGGACAVVAFDLLLNGRTQGVVNAIALSLMWIGGSITFGLATIIHRNPDMTGSIHSDA